MNIEKYKQTLFQDGVVLIKGLFSEEETINFPMIDEKVMSNPTLFGNTIKQENDSSEFFLDFNCWKKVPEIEALVRNIKIISLLKTITETKNIWLHHDNFFSKTGKADPTPWHTDRPYFVFKGDLNISTWLPFQDVPQECSMTFLKGSHKSGKMMIPQDESEFLPFDTSNINSDYAFIDQDFINRHEEISFEMKLGDMVIFFNDTVHGARGHSFDFSRKSLAIRYLLDGAKLTESYIYANPPYDKMGLKIEEDGEIPEKWFPRLF